MLVNLIRTALARLHPRAGYVILILILEKLCFGVRYRTVLCHAPKQQEKGIPMKIGFDNNKYLAMQSAHIRERISQFDNKLYLELMTIMLPACCRASSRIPNFKCCCS